MSTPDFLVASCSSPEFDTVPPIAASRIITSPSLPDVNDSFLHEVFGTVLASLCPSFSHAARKHFAIGQKFRSPISLALTVLNAQFLTLKRRVSILEVEKDSLTLANGVLQSKITSLSGDLSRLRADYTTLLCDRKKLTLAAVQDHQKIRALTSDIDNAQQFIMAMVDIKLHDNFLHVAVNDTVANGEDAEKGLAKAIAQEADREGSLWSRILASVVDIHSTNSYSAAVDFALQEKDLSSGGGKTSGGRKAVGYPPPELHSVCRVTSEGGQRPLNPFSLDGRTPSASSFETKARPFAPLNVSRQSPTSPTLRLSHVSNVTSDPAKISGLGIRYNRRISPPAHFAISQTKMSHTRPHPTSKIEDAMPTRKRTASKKTIQLSETQKQTCYTKNSDKRKGLIITSDVAIISISQKKIGKEKPTLFRALSSLERICASLSTSDLGSLEETSDDDESRSRASDDSVGSLDRPTGRTVGEEASGPLIPSVTAAGKNRSSTISLVPDCPELSPSISASPPSTPPALAWPLYSERYQEADTSPTLTQFSDIIPIVNRDPMVYEDCTSIRSSLNLPKFPMVSGIAKRLSRVITKDNSAEDCVSDGSVSSSLQGNTHLRSDKPASTLKNSSPETSKSKSSIMMLPGRQKSSSKSTTPPKKTATPVKTVPITAPVAPGSSPALRAKRAANLKPEADATPTSNTPQQSKLSVGKNFLRRLSNIPGSGSRTQFGPTTLESSRSTGVGSNRTRIFLAPPTPAPTKSRSQTAGNTSPKPAPKTKPRSNTVNDYSPVKSSPLSQSVITAFSGRPSWKRRSVQVVSSTTQGPRTSDPDKSVHAAALSPRLTEKTPSAKRQGVKNGGFDPTTVTPTAAFMKPVNKSATKVAKRMTNSIKPLIPTWTAGSPPSPSQCGDMFRNSLSMVVR